LGAEPGGDRIVSAHDARRGRAGEEPSEGLLDGGGRAVVVEVVGLDAGDDADVDGELEERAVALVGLDDEPLTVRPRRAAADLVDVASDDERRVEAGGP